MGSSVTVHINDSYKCKLDLIARNEPDFHHLALISDTHIPADENESYRDFFPTKNFQKKVGEFTFQYSALLLQFPQRGSMKQDCHSLPPFQSHHLLVPWYWLNEQNRLQAYL